MIEIKGLENLLSRRTELPNVGWIFTDDRQAKLSKAGIMAATFYIAENEDEEFYGEDHLHTWLEAPTFLAILRLIEQGKKDLPLEDYLAAAWHYLEFDDFLEQP